MKEGAQKLKYYWSTIFDATESVSNIPEIFLADSAKTTKKQQQKQQKNNNKNDKKRRKNNEKTTKKQQKNSKKTAKKNTEISGNFRKFP